MDLERARGLAREATERRSGEVVRSRGPGVAEAKGLPGDWVTEVDLASERAISAFLREETGIPVRGEEEGGGGGTVHWLVDPLDGTTNFLHGFPVVGLRGVWAEAGAGATPPCLVTPLPPKRLRRASARPAPA
jgi:myo-inositol-1(or 4)-monophosphatase